MSNDKALSWSFTEDSATESPIAAGARAAAVEIGVTPLSPATIAFIKTIATAIGAKNVAEVGTGTGVSGLAFLETSPDVALTTIDTDTEAQASAAQSFGAAGIRTGRHRIINGRSADLLPRLAGATYDMVLLDGDPLETPGDVAEAHRILRKGGVLVVAHALAGDRVGDPARRDDVTVSMRNLVKETIEAGEFVSSLVPLGDGLLIGVKA